MAKVSPRPSCVQSDDAPAILPMYPGLHRDEPREWTADLFVTQPGVHRIRVVKAGDRVTVRLTPGRPGLGVVG